jgi:hypothetical protein
VLTHPLPVIDPARTEFGFCRTVCSCPDCTSNCRYIPGYLVPADLDRIKIQLAAGGDLFSWARAYLLASPGARVLYKGQLRRIPTLVPGRRPNGACIFLTEDDRCAIHATAPFGCAFFDSHMPETEADRRSWRGLEAVLAAWKKGDLYTRIWLALYQAGHRALPPEVCRQRMRNAGAPNKLA